MVLLCDKVRDACVQRGLNSQRFRLAVITAAGVAGMVVAHAWFGTILRQIAYGDRLLHYALTQSRVLFDYFGLMAFPVGLCSDHHIPWTVSLHDREALIKLVLVIAGSLGVLYAYIVRRRFTAAIVGMILFHLLLRFFYVVDELKVEYRTYPSMPWVGLLCAMAVWHLAAVIRKESHSRALLATACATALAVTFSALSIQRSTVWADVERLTADVFGTLPHQSACAHRSLQTTFRSQSVRHARGTQR